MTRLLITDPSKPANAQLPSDPIEACKELAKAYPQVKRLIAKCEKLESDIRVLKWNASGCKGFGATNATKVESTYNPFGGYSNTAWQHLSTTAEVTAYNVK